MEADMEKTRDPSAGFLVLELTDRVTPGSGRLEADALRSVLAVAYAQGQSRVALDLSPVTAMDAEALGELAGAFTRLRRAGGDLVLLDPPPRVRRLLEVTRLNTVLPVCSRETQAEVVEVPLPATAPSSVSFLSRVCQGRDRGFAESVTEALSAATESIRLGARVSPVVR
jgi:anti-anti-sigma factor